MRVRMHGHRGGPLIRDEPRVIVRGRRMLSTAIGLYRTTTTDLTSCADPSFTTRINVSTTKNPTLV